MKKLLITFFWFLLPIVFLAYPLDYFLSETLRKSFKFADGEYPVWNDLYAGRIESDIVIYGSSRALKHINPEKIEEAFGVPAYNLGINGHSIYSQLYRHHLLLKYNRKPKLIIQTLDVTSFDINSDFYNPEQYLPYMLYQDSMYYWIRNEFGRLDYQIPLLRFHGKKEAVVEVGKLLCAPWTNKVYRIKGYKPRDLIWNEDFSNAAEQFSNLKAKVDTLLLQEFDQYLGACARENIEVILVNTPVYIEGQKLVSNYKEVMDIYRELSRKHNIPLLDYGNDSISFNRNYFYNSQHLNETGAELFTARMIRDIRNTHLFSENTIK